MLGRAGEGRDAFALTRSRYQYYARSHFLFAAHTGMYFHSARDAPDGRRLQERHGNAHDDDDDMRRCRQARAEPGSPAALTADGMRRYDAAGR